MKSILKWALLLLFTATPALAQIKVEVSFDQEQFLPNEPLVAKVRLINNSGQTLTLGNEVEWLSILVESPKYGIVNQKSNLEQAGEFSVPSSHIATRKVDLNKAFDLGRLGRYVVRAEVSLPQLGELYVSPPRNVDISPGTTIKEVVFGMPPNEEGGKPEFRKFLLVQANHLKDNRLYVRICDMYEEQTFKIFPLGPLISFSRPDAQLDSWNNLHVLFQIGSKAFRFVTISPDGSLMTRQIHEYAGDSRPVLGALENGAIRVKGGVQRPTANDLPPPEINPPKTNYDIVTPPAEAPAAVAVPKEKKPEAPKTLDAKKSKKK